MTAGAAGDQLRDEPVDPDIVSSDVVFDGMVWDVRRDTFRYNGDELTREYIDHTGAAAIVAIDDDERVLLIQQYRHPIRHRDWEIPAGLLDKEGESALETAKRELQEEALKEQLAHSCASVFVGWVKRSADPTPIHRFVGSSLALDPTH